MLFWLLLCVVHLHKTPCFDGCSYCVHLVVPLQLMLWLVCSLLDIVVFFCYKSSPCLYSSQVQGRQCRLQFATGICR